MIVPVLVGQVAPRAVQRELLDALLREHAHVDLQAHQREHREGEHGEDYHIAQILHGFDDGTDDGLQACQYGMMKKMII